MDLRARVIGFHFPFPSLGQNALWNGGDGNLGGTMSCVMRMITRNCSERVPLHPVFRIGMFFDTVGQVREIVPIDARGEMISSPGSIPLWIQ